MDIRPLDEQLAVSPQVAPEDLQAVARAGYRSLISNRPDGEEQGQPSAAEIRVAADEAGLAFAHLPVVGGEIGDGEIAEFRRALADLPEPILGFCRSGARTTTLWALSHAGDRDPDDLISTAGRAGYNLSGLAHRLQGYIE